MKKHYIIWLSIAILGRLIPHPANMTPMTNLCLYAGKNFPRRFAIAFSLMGILISDCLLAWIKGYPALGIWTLFNYTGFIAIIFVGTRINAQAKFLRLLSFVLISGLGFWLWTNFGTWLTSHIYPLTLSGLISCYIAALPFLRNALIGNLAWMIIIFYPMILLFNKRSKTAIFTDSN